MGKKTNDEEKTTLAEAFIHFQIQVKRKEIQEFQEEVSQLEAKNQRFIELREQLKEEQKGHIRALRKQAKEQERKLEQREVVNKEQVEEALQHNLELGRRQENELEELRNDLVGLEEQVLAMQAERQIWLEYKNMGSQEHQQQIQQLEAELAEMQSGYQEMSENIMRSLDATFNEIDKKTVYLIDEKKQLATERAIKHLDKHSRQEIKENEWLQRELAIYQKEVSIMEVAVHSLEGENLEHMRELFEHRLDDLQISRNVFLTQAAGLGPNDSGTPEQTVEKMGLAGRAPPLPPAAEAQGAETELDRDEAVSNSCGSTAAPPPELSVLLHGSQADLQRQPVHLGPLEQKLLSVVGRALPLHPVPPEAHGAGCSAALGLSQAPEGWPLTARIIRKRFQ